jgi:hypothetical protein
MVQPQLANLAAKSWLKEIRWTCRAFSQKQARGIDPNGRKLFPEQTRYSNKKTPRPGGRGVF